MLIIPVLAPFVKKNRGSDCCREGELLLAEGLAIRALILGGVHFVSTHQNPVQRAVVLVLAVISALLDGTLDALVGMAVHGHFLLLNGFDPSMATGREIIQENVSFLAFVPIV